jgi:5-hydroxyisourate hydrolase
MISTHILDTSLGKTAENVQVILEMKIGNSWKILFEDKTNSDGRVVFNVEKISGEYRLTFDIEEYFKNNKQESFFLNVPVAFKIIDVSRKYHVPLLLNPYGYSTYKGS